MRDRAVRAVVVFHSLHPFPILGRKPDWRFLRWHYPDQVQRVEVFPPLSPRVSSPVASLYAAGKAAINEGKGLR